MTSSTALSRQFAASGALARCGSGKLCAVVCAPDDMAECVDDVAASRFCRCLRPRSYSPPGDEAPASLLPLRGDAVLQFAWDRTDRSALEDREHPARLRGQVLVGAVEDRLPDPAHMDRWMGACRCLKYLNHFLSDAGFGVVRVA